jgi:hypothetical protein
MTNVQQLIKQECDSIAELLIRKNAAYGNSFAEPINIFSKCSADEQLNVRIDDKLNRLAKGKQTEQVPEDTELDLIGYLILRRVLRKKDSPKPHTVHTLTNWGDWDTYEPGFKE